MNTILRFSICLFIVNCTNNVLPFPAEVSSETAEEEINEHRVISLTSNDRVPHDRVPKLSHFAEQKESAAATVLNDLKFLKLSFKTMSSNPVNNRNETHLFSLLTDEQISFVPNKRKLTYHLDKCLFKTNSLLKCLFLMHSSYGDLDLDGKSSMTKFQQRRLLSVASSRKSVKNSVNVAKGTVNHTGTLNTSNSTDRLLNEFTLEEYEEFVKVLRQSFSKDPLCAMLSVTFFMIVLMVAIKLCGMKPRKHQKEIPPEYDGATHYVSIYEILKMRRPYLPKKLLRWERRLRRKYKRKKRILKEQDLVEAMSDNSADESLIYSRNHDF